MGKEYVLNVNEERPDNIIRSAATAFLVFLAILVVYLIYQAYRTGSSMVHLLLFAPLFLFYAVAFRKKPEPPPVIFSDRGISLGLSELIGWEDVKYYGIVAGNEASSAILKLMFIAPPGKSRATRKTNGLTEREIIFESARLEDIERLFVDRNISRWEVGGGEQEDGEEKRR